MTLQEIYGLAESSFITFVAILAVLSVYATFKLITKHLPAIGVAFKDGLKAWQDFVKAMNANTESTVNSAKATDNNTMVTDKSFQHQVTVLEELQDVNYKFKAHDINALEATRVIKELMLKLEIDDIDHKDITTLLKQILSKLDEFESWDGIERRDIK